MQEKLDNVGSSPLAALKEILEQSIAMVYDNVTRDIHTPEALLHTSLTMKSRFAHFFVFKRTAFSTCCKWQQKLAKLQQKRRVKKWP